MVALIWSLSLKGSEAVALGLYTSSADKGVCKDSQNKSRAPKP